MSSSKPQKSTKARQQLDKIIDKESKRLVSMLTAAHPRLVINRWPESPIEISMGMLILDNISDNGYYVSTQPTTQLENYPYQRVTISLLRPSHNFGFGFGSRGNRGLKGGIMIKNPLKVQEIILSEAIPVEIVKIPDSKVLNILTQANNIKSPVKDVNQGDATGLKCCPSCKSCGAHLKPQPPREMKPLKPQPLREMKPLKPQPLREMKPKPVNKTSEEERPVQKAIDKPDNIKSDGTTTTKKADSDESPKMVKDAGMKLLQVIIDMAEKQGLCEQKFKEILEVLNKTI